ncbi:hypothetical protein SAMN04515674_11931 [Pseudarcicella hirudinis]|uniref:Uncharacterized protein n=1 Tax=Pseudarcicella hirudinis TaxID=1079859 RepID=A0A1I5YK07_9BACT|nr:hypothetical protein [Pseudarcicella hirudinis]SFQ44207.1 hypothetical protein SAMN04515674_11931 [Pseudarcicella hirudinis]
MSYHSPLHLLVCLQISPDEINAESILRLKSKLLAEFSLTTDITININGTAYTKDAILKIIDQLKVVDDLTIHKEIYSKTSLLNWMENPTQKVFPIDLAKDILNTNTNNDLLQNIMLEAFGEYVKFNFQKGRFRLFANILDFIPNFSEAHSLIIYESLYYGIENVINDINNAKKLPDIKTNKLAFGFISEPNWTDFLNNLPSSFEETRNLYCVSAIDYIVRIQKIDYEWTYEISAQLEQTLCEESLKQVISQNHEICARKSKSRRESQLEGPWIWLPVFIFTALSRIVSCNNSSKPKYDYDQRDNYKYSVPAPSYRQPLDSLLH